MGGTRLGNWGPAEFGWVARGSGAGGPRSLDGWHAAIAEFGWVARGSGWHAARSWGPRSLDGWHAARGAGGKRSLVAGTRLGSWGPRSLDGWHATLELGAEGPRSLDGTRAYFRSNAGFASLF